MKKLGRPTKAAGTALNTFDPDFEIRRTGGRLKKAKKVFDPSENYLRKRRYTTYIDRDEYIADHATSSKVSKSWLQLLDELNLDEEQNVKSEIKQSKDISKQEKRGRKSLKLQEIYLNESAPEHKISKSRSFNLNESPTLESSNSIVLKKIISENVAKKPRGRPRKLPKNCSICLKTNDMKLITCFNCVVKGHLKCLKTKFVDKNLLQKWRCHNCAKCETCFEKQGESKGKLITCNVCVRNYHALCHIPVIDVSISNTDQVNWTCGKCVVDSKVEENFEENSLKMDLDSLNNVEKQNFEKIKTSELAKILINNHDNSNEDKLKPLKTEKLEPELNLLSTGLVKKDQNFNKENVLPDITTWSCEKLTELISEIFPNEAHVVPDNEIDGAALLLITRDQVLNQLGLKMGPALRLYNYIIRLQTRKIDQYATWFY